MNEFNFSFKIEKIVYVSSNLNIMKSSEEVGINEFSINIL